jgi:hypothetical protein
MVKRSSSMPAAASSILATKSAIAWLNFGSASSWVIQARSWAFRAASSWAFCQARASKSLFTTKGDILNMVST